LRCDIKVVRLPTIEIWEQIMNKVLLVDTNFSSAPIYNDLVQSGCEVFVVGGNPEDFLAKSTKNYINLDYSNVDRIREVMPRLIQKGSIMD